MNTSNVTVIAIDPGRIKCGIAVVRKSDGTVEVLHREVIPTTKLGPTVANLASRFSPDAVVLGGGTSSSAAARVVENLQSAPVVIVEEKFSTLAARKRYFEENPPRGLRRLIPLSLQVPPHPYDDYVAVMLAEKYLQGL